jgi:TrmH family RNA methyltransferase
MDVLTSRANRTYRYLARLKRSRGAMMLEGRRLVEDALSRGIRPRTLVASESFASSHGMPARPDVVLSDQLFETLADTQTTQGIMGFFDTPWARLGEVLAKDRIVVLDGLQDPGNVGAITRTAEAFGFQGMVVLDGTASPFSTKAVRASMGSCLGLLIAKGSPRELAGIPHRIVALSVNGPEVISPHLFRGRFALCLGQEAAGITAELDSLAHHRVCIPMKGRTESLNVAVASGIVMACAAGVFKDGG